MQQAARRQPSPAAPLRGAVETRDRIAAGEARAVEETEACLARIVAGEDEIQAWAHLDTDLALEQARSLDRRRAAGLPLGPLHGVPVGLKDIIDTRDMPTENGTPLDSGRRPARDAALVARLRAAGAVIVGKTVTTELAYAEPSRTRNPHDRGRTPGGSSSGSAAAVAAGMVPLAVGTQTNGSVIRPASFCGVVGFKPSFGLISRTGVLRQTQSLDTVGVFGRSIEDAALAAEVMQGFDPGDEAVWNTAHYPLLETARSRPPVRPTIAFVRSPVWERADGDMRGAVEETAAALGTNCEEVALPEAFAGAHQALGQIMVVGFARHLRAYVERGGGVQPSEKMRAAIEEGSRVTAVDYLAALSLQTALRAALEPLFDRYDAIITPGAPGEAPAGFATTGDPAFNTIWSLCGCPAITLPLAVGSNGLPLGIQVVGRPAYDGRLLRTARWLSETVLSGGDAAAENTHGDP